MGKDSAWKYTDLNCASNLAPPPLGQWSQSQGFAAHKFLQSDPNPSQRRFMVFDPLPDQTDLVLRSAGGRPRPRPTMISPGVELPSRNGTAKEEMQEDSDEIDALLYSDSELEEEEASTDNSPPERANLAIAADEEAVSSSAVPAKRRRVEAGLDESVTDTASSAGGGKRLKRERIKETVGVLSRIIPGGRGKDAATVIDVAIRYLRSLKLQATSIV